jgi:hypothetical protein
MPILVIALSILIFYLFFGREKSPKGSKPDFYGDAYKDWMEKYAPKIEKIYIVTEGRFKGDVLNERELAEAKAALKREQQKFINEMIDLRESGKITEDDYNKLVDSVLDDMIQGK